MIKKIFFALVLVLFATSAVAQSGLTCDDPIPVDNNYVGTIPGAGEYWFSAWTYDLPMTIFFLPNGEESDGWGPEVYADFTCKPGVYDDPKLDHVINGVSSLGFELPVEFVCEQVTSGDRVAYRLTIGEFYRNQLAEAGITYNVQAFVRVVFTEGGDITLKPDTTYKKCMENSRMIQLGDTLDILPNDSSSTYIFPYSEWKNDSIQFVWLGDDKSRVWLAVSECDFTPIEESGYVQDFYDLQPAEPYKLHSQQIKDIIDATAEGGVFFSKILSPKAGRLVIEKIPLKKPMGGAILLEYDKPIQLVANDTSTLYCFPKVWNATQMVANTNRSVIMYLSLVSDFVADENDAQILGQYKFVEVGQERISYLSSIEMDNMFSQTLDDYIYVRFKSDVATTLVPKRWDASSCADESIQILPNTAFKVKANSSKVLYRLEYANWQGCGMMIKWSGNSTLPTYIADDCQFVLNANAPAVVFANTIKRKGSIEIESAIVDEWASRVSDEGFLYVRFNPANQGNITFNLVEPAKPDPIYTTIAESVCFGESYTWNGQTYSTTGEYQQTFVAANGADSIVTLQLTVRPELPATEEHVTVAYGETHTWNGVTYTESGSYSVTLQDAFGCDSVVTLHLTVLPNPNRTELYPNDYMILNLASAFKVFTMEHLSWVAQDVNIHWGGTSPLYVFIASENDFALTPYNRYVLHYEEIAAGGDWVLTAAQMASWAQHAAAAGGKVYVRFLTEFEGELTTKGL